MGFLSVLAPVCVWLVTSKATPEITAPDEPAPNQRYSPRFSQFKAPAHFSRPSDPDSSSIQDISITPDAEPPGEMLKAYPRPEDTDDLNLIRAWARQNQETALAWMLSSPPGTKREAVAEICCAQLAQSDPAQAVALAEVSTSDSCPLLENMLHHWAVTDVAAARAYALSKPEGEIRDRLMSRVAMAFSTVDPLKAAEWVADDIPAGEIQFEAAMSVLHQWALLDSVAAANWAETFLESHLKDRAIEEVKNLHEMSAY